MSSHPPQSVVPHRAAQASATELRTAIGVISAIAEAVLVTDLDGHVTLVNDAFLEPSALSRSEVLGKEISVFTGFRAPSHDVECSSLAPHSATRDNRSATAERSRFVWRTKPLLDDAGLKTGWMFFGQPISISRRTDSNQTSLEQLAAFPRWNPNPVLEFDGSGFLSYFNEATLELVVSLGETRVEDILPQHTEEIVLRSLATGLPLLRLERAYGEHVISWSFFPIQALGVVHCYAGDVTERHTLEQQYRQSQKLESLGRLAGGVAHDFNNLLTVIKGQASCLATGQLAPGAEAEALQHILLAADRGSNLTRQLLTFSRQHTVQFRSVDLNEAIRSVDRLLSRVVGEHIEFQLDSSTPVSPVWADVSMIEQILLNLAVNSRDAMPDGGQVRISTTELVVGPEYAAKNPDSQQGTYVRLTFQDSGCGIPSEHLPRIFEPFFSTKAPGKGTGLGLATVYGIVKQHQGWIRVFSTVGQGTTFQIHLPSTEQPLHRQSSGAGPAAATQPGGRETILLAEDEDPVRSLVAGALRARGYRVHEARNGAEALDLFLQFEGQIDLLLADVVMPGGLNGRELAIRLVQKKPSLHVLLITGYSADPAADQNGLPESFPCLAKPFDLDDLQRSLREALAV